MVVADHHARRARPVVVGEGRQLPAALGGQHPGEPCRRTPEARSRRPAAGRRPAGTDRRAAVRPGRVRSGTRRGWAGRSPDLAAGRGNDRSRPAPADRGVRDPAHPRRPTRSAATRRPPDPAPGATTRPATTSACWIGSPAGRAHRPLRPPARRPRPLRRRRTPIRTRPGPRPSIQPANRATNRSGLTGSNAGVRCGSPATCSSTAAGRDALSCATHRRHRAPSPRVATPTARWRAPPRR